MAVTVVQTAATSSTTTNPTLKYQARPTAGDFLLAYCMQQSATMPGIPTDTAGNAWQMIACAERPADSAAPTGLSVCIYRVPQAQTASTTVSFATTAGSCVAIQELSGVLADATSSEGFLLPQPDYATAGFAGPGTSFLLGVSPGSASEYAQALIVCLDQTATFTLDTAAPFAGWTADRAFAGAGLSVQLAHQVISASSLVHWTASTPVVGCVIGVSLAHS